jgi:hypothetical protein
MKKEYAFREGLMEMGGKGRGMEEREIVLLKDDKREREMESAGGCNFHQKYIDVYLFIQAISL